VCTVLIVVASSLVGFYFYGKAAAKQAIKIEATEPAGE
jgi:hypothetical protein